MIELGRPETAEVKVTFPILDQIVLSFYHVREQGRPHHC